MAMVRAVAVDALQRLNAAIEELDRIDTTACSTTFAANIATARAAIVTPRDNIAAYIASSTGHTDTYNDD